MDRQSRLKKLGTVFGTLHFPASSQPPQVHRSFLATLGKWGRPLAPVPSQPAWSPKLRATAPAPAFYLPMNVNANPLLGGRGICWDFLQPLALVTGPATYVSSWLAASQQKQLSGKNILKSIFCAEEGLDWSHQLGWGTRDLTWLLPSTQWHRGNTVQQNRKMRQDKSNLFFSSYSQKMLDRLKQEVHSVMVICGCNAEGGNAFWHCRRGVFGGYDSTRKSFQISN